MKTRTDAWARTNRCPGYCFGQTPVNKPKLCEGTSDQCLCSYESAHLMGRKCSACKYGWSNHTDKCNAPVCNPPCANGGSCVSAFTCNCPPHATGPRCETCASGWGGPGCKTFVCESCTSSKNPKCVGPNTCELTCFGLTSTQMQAQHGTGYTCVGPNKVAAPDRSKPCADTGQCHWHSTGKCGTNDENNCRTMSCMLLWSVQ